MVAGSILVGLALHEAVAENLREVGVTGLVVVGFNVMVLGMGGDSAGAEDDGIVVVQGVGSHASRYFRVGRQGFVVHTQSHLRRGNHAAGPEGLAIVALVEKCKMFFGLHLLIDYGISFSNKAVSLCAAEVQIAVAIVRMVAPRQAVAILGIVLGMTLVVVETVENALPQGNNLIVAVQFVEGVDLTLAGNDKGIHAVDAAGSVEVADGLVELGKTLVLLSQMRHYIAHVGLAAPAFCLLALFLTEFGLLCSPMHIFLVVGLGTAGCNEQVKDILLFRSVVAYGVVTEQFLADEDGRVLTLLHKRLAIDPGTDALSAVFANVT